MPNQRIRGKQITDPRTITQNEHEDKADARRVLPVDQDGEFFGTPENPISVNSGSAASANPIIFNVDCPDADTEYSQALPDKTKQFLIKVRGGRAIMKVAFSETESSTNYITVDPGVSYKTTDISVIGKNVYFQLNSPGKVVEIIAWY